MAISTTSIASTYKSQTVGNPFFQAILTLLLLVIFSWFMVRPRLVTTLATHSDMTAAQKQLDGIQADQRELDRLVNEMHSSPEDVALVDEALPLSGRISRVNVLLDSLVRSSGMTLAVISSDDTASIISAGDKDILNNPFQPGRKLHTLTVQAAVTGTMEQLKNLMQLVETNGRVLDVENLKVIGGEQATKYQLTVKAYAYEQVLDPKAAIAAPNK